MYTFLHKKTRNINKTHKQVQRYPPCKNNLQILQNDLVLRRLVFFCVFNLLYPDPDLDLDMQLDMEYNFDHIRDESCSSFNYDRDLDSQQ